jgi:SH3 domain-containing protein
VSYAPQFSPGLVPLPACIVACLLLATAAAAQQDDALTTPADLHREPEGAPLVSLPAGAPVETGEARGDWKQVTVEGWISTSSTAPTRRDGFDLIVIPGKGENLRRSPNGSLLGRVREGTLLERVAVKGGWTRVRREGWVPRQAMAATPQAPRSQGTPQATQAKAPAAGPKPSAEPAPMELAREAPLRATPDGAPLAMIVSGVPARVTARTTGWVKVQLDGWVKEEDLKLGAAGAFEGVTATEVRTSPDRYIGQILQWRVQLIAVQSADELRSEMAPGQPYLLTRGPLPEPGFVYITIPAERVAQFSALPPLRELVLRVTLRAVRTRYLTTPVAALESVVSGMEGS